MQESLKKRRLIKVRNSIRIPACSYTDTDMTDSSHNIHPQVPLISKVPKMLQVPRRHTSPTSMPLVIDGKREAIEGSMVGPDLHSPSQLNGEMKSYSVLVRHMA